MRACREARSLLFLLFAALLALPVQAALTIEPLTWNVVGLDSNSPLSGPNHFPVGARVCSDVATTNVAVDFVWDSANAFVNLRSGSLSTVLLPSISAGGCADAYFEAEITRNPAAFDTTRRYHITATDGSGTVSTPTPRELYVEHLISQSRNAISDVLYGPTPLDLTSVPAGGSMALVVGNTYAIQLRGGTATQGYNQFEAFINFTNTIFQILNVETTYSANDSPNVSGPAPAIHDQLYADACGWENDPNSPNYRACVGGDFKSGGSDVITTYTIKIIGGGGTSETLNTLLYDFSGSSFHYNADYGTGARIANIIDPTAATISKSFAPNPAGVNGVSVLTITLGNPNAAPVGGYNFVDNLPAGLEIAATPGATTSGCGTPTLSAPAGGTAITFSDGAVAANSTCVINVNVTAGATGTYDNTTNNLFIDAVDTGKTASASLTVNSETPGTGLCGAAMAQWLFPAGFSTTTPAPSTASVTASAQAGAGLSPATGTNTDVVVDDGTSSWRSNGGVAAGTPLNQANNDFFEFTVDATGFTSVSMSFDALRTNNGPKGLAVFAGTTPTTQLMMLDTALSAATTWFTFDDSDGLTLSTPGGGNVVFRIYGYNSNNDNPGSDLSVDRVTFTGCATPIDPTISKSFSPDPVAVGGVSTLTFTLTNNNTAALTGAEFSDALPAGVQVAATPAASTTCGGSWAPSAGDTTLAFGQVTGGTIPASSSCTVSVNVTATTAGPHSNVSGFLETIESGTAGATVATDTLTAVLPPVIAKQFSPSPVIPGGVTTLTFTVTNPNPDDALSGVAFTDTFPVAPGSMTVATTPNASTSGCGAPTFAPSPGAGSVTFSGGAIAAAATCVVTVDVTAPAIGTYANTSGNVSHVLNAQTVNGNTASDSLLVNAPDPAISLLKQVGPTASGPWSKFLAVAAAGDVFYRFTIENIGDVPVSSISVTDDTLDVSACNSGFSGLTLPVAVAANDDHIVTCVTGAIAASAGSHTNTASSGGDFGGTPVASGPSQAQYATTGLTLDKTAAESSFTIPGDQLNYSYLVTNSGFAPLQGPVSVTDDKTAVTCPAVSTVGDLDNFLDPGESITCTAAYTILAGDVVAGSVTNTATATVDSVSSNSDSVTVVSTTAADVSVVKTLTSIAPFAAGDSVSYTITVANAGPSTASNIQVTDTPANLTITGVSGSGCAALPCTIASLASGANTVINVTATITAAGAFNNSATADADEPDPDPTNNTGADGDSAGASADVSVVKTLTSTGPFTIGDAVTFTIDVTNAGPSIATSVEVTDTPANLTITGVSGSGCVAFPCTIASIGAGVTTSITVTGTINADGAFGNSAAAAADEPDPDLTNNSDDDGDTAAASADVSLGKTLTTAGPYLAGQSVTFTIDITNAGPSVATSVNVTDTPTNLTITNVSGACATLPCTIASIGVGATTSITVTATINAPGAFENSAAASAIEPDPDPLDNSDADGSVTGASADISVVKALTTAGPFAAGDSVSYTITIANAGPSTATNIQVTDTPTNLTITGVSGACAALPCTIASLASGANTVINVTATIDAAGAFNNSATVDADEPDPDPLDDTDDDGDTASASADVSVVKALTTAGPFAAGDSVSYTITVANAGPSTATNIQVTDTPTNLTITNVSGACAALPCTIASLASGANTGINVTATIDAAGAFSNSATADADEPDPDPIDDTDDDGDTASASADVSVVKTLTSTGPFAAGDSIDYTITIANAGPSTATNIQVTDTPTNLTITNVSGACAALPCTIASLASGANTVINVTATIDAAGAFSNSATVDADEPDPDPIDDTDDDGDTASASADVSVVKTLTSTGPFAAGDSIDYTITIANAGPSTATNIQVTDTPTNLTITNVSGACAALPCTIASLAAGANTVINVTATIDAAGAFSNSATADADEPDPDPIDDTDDDGDTASASADVSVVKTLTSTGPFAAGDSVSYTITVANAGPSTATNIQVTDTPTNLTITGVSGACAALPCTIASLASGANTGINVTATIDAAGAFSNSADATAAELDPDPLNNSDDDGNSATESADVSVVKTLTTAGPFTAGQTVTFTIDVTNAGPSVATSVNVTDTPTNLTITNVSGACATLPCTIASIGVGATTSITVTATVNAPGAFENSAAASAIEPDPDPLDNSDADGSVTGASADISVVKALTTAGPFAAGDSVSYTITVANAGPSTATNIQVTDTPTNLTITGVSGACAALPCTIASLASGANTVINVTATIDAAGAFSNSADATAAELDPDPLNNSDDDGNSATESADVSVVKTLTTAGPFTAGQTVTFTIDITNAGPSVATSVNVTDTPTNLTITNVSGACATLPCTIASIGVGATISITVTATINAPGAFENSAAASAIEPDPDPLDNSDADGSVTGASADISVVKALTTAGPFAAGDSVSYTITIANAGPSTATNIQITDTPTNLTITNVSGACAALPCTIASLAAGANTVINVTATIDAAGAFSNSATVDADEPDPDPLDDTDDDGDTASASADVSVVKALTTAGPFAAGDSVSYTITVANAGPSTATNIQVTDTPTNLTITNVSGACAALPCTIASLASGANTVINVTATIDAAGAFSNSATADADEPDPDPLDDTDDDGDTASASADVSVVKALTTAGPFAAGDSVSYTITVANAGPSTATNIQVTDTPTNLTITGVSGACAALPCTIASVASGANTVINVTATIDAAGAFSNSATADADEPDPDPLDDTDDDGDTASASADISVVKALTTAGPFAAGDSVSYTITIANAGPSTATNIQVTDTPTNLTITNVSGACAALPCTIASLAAGANTVINVTATIDAAGAFSNSATVDADEPDPDPANNSDDDGSATGAPADVSVVKTLTSAGPFTVGDSVTFTITVANAGPATATNVQLTDTPANLAITSVSGAGCVALPCTIASVNAGANAEVTVTATITAGGLFSNSATATADEPDSDPINNTDDDGDIAAPSADLSVVKTLTTAGPYFAGQSVTFTIVVANSGPSTATNVLVTDTPSNLTITSVSGSGCAALPCTIASLASGADTTITVTGTIGAGGAFANTATVSGEPVDPDPSDNSDDDGSLTDASADVSVVKTLTSAGPFAAGDSIDYTITIANAGPSTATNIQVTDTPTNLTITGVSGACAALPCTIASLASGANAVITVNATIAAAGAFSNAATVEADEPDPDPTDNTDEDGDTASGSADVSVAKTLTTPGPFIIGQSVTYSITVANAGPSAATNVQVTDTPANLTITSVSGAGCVSFPCTIASLEPGASATIMVAATIGAAGPFSNTATVNAEEPDTDPNDDSDDDGDIASGSADLAVVKTLTTAGPYAAGSSVTFTIVVSNNGPSTATNVLITDTPANLTITAVSGSGCTAVPCTIASIAMGDIATVTVTGMITADGAFGNTATVDGSEPDPDSSNNTDDDGSVTGAAADVSIVKALVTAGPYAAGDTITYSVVVANAGPSTATDIQVTDTASNLTIAGVSGACAALPCRIASLAAGTSVTINVSATIEAEGEFDNVAAANALEPDPDPVNNSDEDGNGGNATGPSVDLAITKTASAATLAVGQTFDFELIVTNNGPDTATNVVVSDALPALFSLSSVTTTQGGCTGTTTVTCSLGTMLNGSSVTITLTGSATGPGTLVNTATVSATEVETVMANNSSSAAPVVAGAGTDIPTASEWALILLAMALAAAGALTIRSA